MSGEQSVFVFAQAFLSHFGQDCGKRLSDVAREIGLEIEELDAESFDGALLRASGVHRGVIALNRNIREPGRKRFTLAHEIGHYVLPSHGRENNICGSREVENWRQSLAPPEVEANLFAAEILMPVGRITDALRAEPSFAAVRQIAETCDVSLTAATYRLVERSSFRVAFVYSVEGRSVWYKASTDFGRGVRLGPLSPDSFAADCFSGTSTPSRPEPVPAEAWLFEQGLADGARVWEQAVSLPFYGSVLSLLYLRERVEGTDDEAEEDTSLDPKEFTLQRKRWPSRR